MSVFLSPNLPANVVEIGNEISQAKINEINAGTLALQTWVSASFLTTASAASTYATRASPTFTGTVTIPAGASISGYLTTASASSTYQTISGMSSYATQSYVTSQGYLTDAPSNGSEYVRKNGTWSVATGGGGGGGIADAPATGYSYVRQMNSWVAVGTNTYEVVTTQEQVAAGYYPLTGNPSGFLTSLSVTNIDLTGNFNGYSMGSGYYTFKFDSSANTLRMQDGAGSGVTVSATGITFPDSTTITSAPVLNGYVNGGVSGYTLTQSDNNKVIEIGATSGALQITLSGTFVAGSRFYIVNRSNVFGLDIVAGGMTGYTINDNTSGNYTIGINTMKTMVCISSSEFYIS
jgi:hypothetical protein